ncbi:MAG: PQQ-dependent dehydrogenase, methanol/ethanol family [Candidatus Binatia bacterium]
MTVCTRILFATFLVAIASSGAGAAGREDAIRKAAAAIDDARLRAAPGDGASWITHGGDLGEQRFSPLDRIDDDNVDELELLWVIDTGMRRGHEATPIVFDGVMYVTTSWSVVIALDPKTGEEIWRYDPKVPREWGARACCDVVNRGVAVYEGKVYVGTIDGRLVALDAATGKVVWEKLTIDPKKSYTITHAPRVADGKVLVGNGGAEYGVRGYVSAYDPGNGELVWRTYTVPGDPAKRPESEALKVALETWKDADEWLKIGAGGTVWDSISYDPELGLVYVGTGNGVAWDRSWRSPGGGDNLYLASILALDANTGEQKWHYQATPGDTWDFDSAQQMTLAELEIDGEERRVLMQASKNGFFYVLDRKTGELLSANPFAEVTWAKKVDLDTGRPIEMEGVRYEKGQAVVKPTMFGAHNWQPMSYSPETGLVYIPVHEITGAYATHKDFKVREAAGVPNLGIELGLVKDLNRSLASGHLLAFDPVEGKEAWRAQYGTAWNGGTLVTKGNLVFQGTADGRFVAYRADDGKKLWERPVGTGVIAAPVTYLAGGVQQVTIVAGWGGTFALLGGDAAAAAGVGPGGKVLTYALRKKDEKAPAAEKARAPSEAEKRFVRGEYLYHHNCVGCHGAAAVGGGVLPDLRRSGSFVHQNFLRIVAAGIPDTGMPAFATLLSKEEIELIQNYVQEKGVRDGVR